MKVISELRESNEKDEDEHDERLRFSDF